MLKNTMATKTPRGLTVAKHLDNLPIKIPAKGFFFSFFFGEETIHQAKGKKKKLGKRATGIHQMLQYIHHFLSTNPSTIDFQVTFFFLLNPSETLLYLLFCGLMICLYSCCLPWNFTSVKFRTLSCFECLIRHRPSASMPTQKRVLNTRINSLKPTWNYATVYLSSPSCTLHSPHATTYVRYVPETKAQKGRKFKITMPQQSQIRYRD